MNSSVNTLRFHDDGTLSYRINGKWTREVPAVDQTSYFKLPDKHRRKLIYTELKWGRSLIVPYNETKN
jgi:hypothetical protein